MYMTLHDGSTRMTEAEYLTFADAQELKHEYSHGRVIAISGASVRHNIISASVIIQLGNQLSAQDCTVTTSDTRVYIASKGAYRYPDVTVFCGAPLYLTGRTDTLTNPMMLVEVLSPSTAIHDDNEKLEEYTQIESLQAYVLIAQDAPKIELFRRYAQDKWLYEYATGLESALDVPLAEVTLRLVLAQIYQRVQWGDDAPEDEG